MSVHRSLARFYGSFREITGSAHVGAAHEWGNLALMTSADITVLPTDEVCRLLGIEERRLKQLIRDRVLIEARGDDGVRGVPQEVLVKGANGWEPLPFLQGTLTLLADDGFTAEESLAWLYAEQDELGERPIDALTSGRHHRVNRIASTIAF